jgi:dihydrofolate reductase
MRKIIVGAQVSLDGVMQAPGAPQEDPTNGFKFGGWAMPHFDQVSGEEIGRLFEDEFDLLLGRRTYEIFAAYWPYYKGTGRGSSTATMFNDVRKYVVSGSGDVDTSWQHSVLLRDLTDLQRLREEDGPNLLTQGSTALVHALFAADLVDAFRIFCIPVVLGGGKKLFADGSAPHGYKLTHSRVSTTGIIAAHYERAGDVPLGNAAPDAPSDAERARRERVKREG